MYLILQILTSFKFSGSMKVPLAILILVSLVIHGSCSILATKGYLVASPRVRNFLIRSGIANVIGRKATALYEASNFRYASDQGTDIRKAEMDGYHIVEVKQSGQLEKRSGLVDDQNLTKEEDRMYSERLFTVLNEMDRNACVSRLMCEIGADPESYGTIGMKIHNYLK